MGRGGQLQDRDLESGQALDQPVGVAVHHHQVRLVADDRLDVGLEPGQLGLGRLRRVVRVTVDRLDLAARADRVEHLGARGGQRNDRSRPRADVNVPVGGRHGGGEAARAAGGRARCAAGGLGAAARGARGGESCGGREGRQTARENLHDHPPSGRGGRSAPAATPTRHRNEPPFLRGQYVGTSQASGLIPRGGITVAGQRRHLGAGGGQRDDRRRPRADAHRPVGGRHRGREAAVGGRAGRGRG